VPGCQLSTTGYKRQTQKFTGSTTNSFPIKISVNYTKKESQEIDQEEDASVLVNIDHDVQRYALWSKKEFVI